MTNRTWMLLLVSISMIIWGCSKDETGAPSPTPNTPNPTDNSWLIAQSEVFDGGPGKDGIPSVDDPAFVPASQIDYMTAGDLIIGIQLNGMIKGYTHPVLDWHEIVNDRVGGTPIALTYCPLTGTGSAWSRSIKGEETTFGVSGLLYRNNLIPYDRNTDSNWSQMRLECVQGDLKSTRIETYPVVEMPWETWSIMFPNEPVITTETGFSRNYNRYPYGDYKENDDNIIFPIGDDDDRLPAKERVLSVILLDKSKVYTFAQFEDGLRVIHDEFEGLDVLIVGSKPHNFMMAFANNTALGRLTFKALDISAGGVILEDQLGNQWNIFGQAVSGPDAGMSLGHIDAMMGYWFSFGAFYEPEIYGG